MVTPEEEAARRALHRQRVRLFPDERRVQETVVVVLLLLRGWRGWQARQRLRVRRERFPGWRAQQGEVGWRDTQQDVRLVRGGRVEREGDAPALVCRPRLLSPAGTTGVGRTRRRCAVCFAAPSVVRCWLHQRASTAEGVVGAPCGGLVPLTGRQRLAIDVEDVVVAARLVQLPRRLLCRFWLHSCRGDQPFRIRFKSPHLLFSQTGRAESYCGILEEQR